jgi:branched-chain amino acid transport system ATP-binding protein
MLSVKSIECFYGRSQALFGMSLEVNAGEVVTLLGRNGMGKSTTIQSIMGIMSPKSGSIEFEGKTISKLPSSKVARLGLGLVPEGRQIFPNLNVRENLEATAANRQSKSAPWTLDSIYEMFPSLKARESSMGNLLSGGEQQMLAIGRALMTNPQLLILDEATEGLAPLVRQQIWDCLTMLKDQGQSILVVDKNVADLARIADRHYIIEKGQTVWKGDSSSLLADADLQKRYLGI